MKNIEDKIKYNRVPGTAPHYKFNLSESQKEYMTRQSLWIEDSVSRPLYNDKYFILIEDNGNLMMDILEHCGTKDHGDAYYGWETFDQRKYTEKARIKYWLHHDLS